MSLFLPESRGLIKRPYQGLKVSLKPVSFEDKESSRLLLKNLDFTFPKGTVSVISSDPPCKDGNARFTTVPKVLMEGKLIAVV